MIAVSLASGTSVALSLMDIVVALVSNGTTCISACLSHHVLVGLGQVGKLTQVQTINSSLPLPSLQL